MCCTIKELGKTVFCWISLRLAFDQSLRLGWETMPKGQGQHGNSLPRSLTVMYFLLSMAQELPVSAIQFILLNKLQVVPFTSIEFMSFLAWFLWFSNP